MKAIPASSTFLANEAFSERKPYLQSARSWNDSPRVNHVHTVFQSNSDDIVLCQVGRNRRHPLADHVTLVGLVPVCAHPVLVRVDGDSGHGEFVGRSEDSDSDFTTVGDKDFL